MTLFSRIVTTGYYKKVLIAICLCVAVFAEGGFVQGQKPEARLIPDCCGKSQYFNDFIVLLRDSNKKDRLLICDVAIELNQGMKVPEEIAGLRKIIYKTLKELSGSPEIGRKLKEAIKIRLNSFMGDEIIKSVYFTKFVLL